MNFELYLVETPAFSPSSVHTTEKKLLKEREVLTMLLWLLHAVSSPVHRRCQMMFHSWDWGSIILSVGPPVTKTSWNRSVADPNKILFWIRMKLKNKLLSMRRNKNPRNCIIKTILRLQLRSTSVLLLSDVFLHDNSAPVFIRLCPLHEK